MPQTQHYLPHNIFGHNSFNNLLLFFQPQSIEDQLALIEIYLVLNDFNSAESLIEQVYDNVKHIGKFAEEEDEICTEIIPPSSSSTSSRSSSSSSSSAASLHKVPICCTREELLEKVSSLRAMLKSNSSFIRVLKTAAGNAYLEGFTPVIPSPWISREERDRMRKEQKQKQQQQQ